MKLALIVPAHNEADRIAPTLQAYHQFLVEHQPEEHSFFIATVLNGCTDNTEEVIKRLKVQYPHLVMLESAQAGKGLAIKAGLEYALEQKADMIGYVDADMATRPEYFYQLVTELKQYDGAIASRYMADSRIQPARPLIKRWGSKFIYEPLIKLLFGMQYHDYQCGAKVFRYETVKAITPYLSVEQWAFDLELLFLCKKNNFTIKEVPTVWFDQADSKLRIMKSGIPMLRSLFTIRRRH